MAFYEEFERLKIKLEEIKSATNNFNDNNVIGKGAFGKVYKGEISHSKGRSMVAFKRLEYSIYGQGIPEFWGEIKMLSRYTHDNIVSLLGYCDEGREKILLYELAFHGSLDHHLHATTLTWRQRVKICLGVAKGLSYLHDPNGTQQRVLHRDIKSANILLDENWNAKLSDFGLSKFGPANQQYTGLVTNFAGTWGYCDPLYMKEYLLTKESDVYSFGVVLFEVLIGRLCFESRNGQFEFFVQKWKQSYEQNELSEIIIHDLFQQMDPISLKTFSDIAYKCLKRSREDRPQMADVVTQLAIALEPHKALPISDEDTYWESKLPNDYRIMAFYKEFERLQIKLKEIKTATNNFDDKNVIGRGAFGKVYKAEISHSKGRSIGAIKRLDIRYGQGNSEFWKEIIMLSRYTHENLISLLGYCDEGHEKILLYEFAFHGSLDRHLHATTLTWRQRVKICLGVAKGLSYLHDPNGTQQRVLHRDIKSSNILLDENWNAKVSGLGLSKIGPANQQHTVLVTGVVGTPGYCDPMYMEEYLLTKESDVYSFGVVLFEVLIGRLCFEFRNGQFEDFVQKWKQSYEQNKLSEIIIHDLFQQMDPISLKMFSDIAYKCLLRSREDRPQMADVVKQLEIALEPHKALPISDEDIDWESKLPNDYEELIKLSTDNVQ